MKLANKLISILLIIATVFGATEPFIMTVQASDVSTPKRDTVSFGAAQTLGTTKVDSAPEKLQRMGEWIYWAEDGLAYVAGYENIDETSLVIPTKLGGYPVVGIGKHAFVKNTNLTTIQIHTNVTRISEDAFLGLNGLTIAAYHGSYALLYAGRYGYPSKNLSTECVFAENVLDLSGLSSSSYFDLSEYGVKFKPGEATFLAEGQILSFPAYAGHPTGSVGKVSEITENSDFVSVSLSEPEWGECFKQVTGEEKLIGDWDHIVYYQYDDMEILEVEPSKASAYWKNKIKIKLNNGRTLELGFSFDLKDMDVSYKIEKDLFQKPEVKSAKVYIPYDVTASVKYGDKATFIDPNGRMGQRGWDGGYDRQQEAQFIKRNLFDLPVFSIGGVVNGYLSCGFIVELKGEVEVSATISYEFVFAKENNKTSKRFDHTFNNFKVEASAELKAGPQIEFDLEVGWKGFNIRLFEASIFGGLKITGNAKFITIKSGVEPYLVDMDAALLFEVEVKVKIGIVSWEFLGYSSGNRTNETAPVKSYLEIKGTFGPYYILRGHWENMSRTAGDKCSLKSRNVIYSLNNQCINSFTADVNDRLPHPDPERPKINGYKFEGWYVNTAASGLKGPDYLFDFSKDLMPYSKMNNTIQIYAKLSKILHPVTSISLNHTSITDYTSNKSGVQLMAAINPANADDPSVTWTSSNNNVCRVSNTGRVTYVGPGTATITCRSDSNQSVFASCNFVVKQYVENISVSGSVASIVAGDTEQLSSVVSPSNATNKSLSWSSSDSNVASVDGNGKVTGYSNGMVTITATARDGSGVTGSYNLQVIEEPAVPPIVPVTSIFLSSSNLVLYTKDGYTQPFEYTVLPADADDLTVIWTSSNPNIITINNSGMASLNGPGTALVTGRSRTNPRVSVTCKVTVIQNVESIAVTANKTQVDMGETSQLSAFVSPVNASDRSITWVSSDPQIGTINSSGVFTGLSRGMVFINAIANDGSGTESNSLRMIVGTNVPITALHWIR